MEATYGQRLTDFVTDWLIPLGVVGGIVLLCYAGLLAYVYLRAQAGYQLYLFVRREVKGLHKAMDEGTEVEGVKNWEELEGLLRGMLEKEKILKPEKRATRPSA